MIVQMILRTNYEGQGEVRGRAISPRLLELYPPLLRTAEHKMVLVQVSFYDGSCHDDEYNEVFTGCCYPYKRIVALDESQFRYSCSSSSTSRRGAEGTMTTPTTTTTTAFDLFYITTQERDHDENKENSNDNMIWIHQLALVPTGTNCRDWESWTFLGECQTCMLRLHIAKYLKQLLQSFLSVQKRIVKNHPSLGRPPASQPTTSCPCHHEPTISRRRRRAHHWHMEAFIDRIIIPTHPPHWLADHPNIHQCSRAYHARLSRHRAATSATRTAAVAASALSSSPRQTAASSATTRR